MNLFYIYNIKYIYITLIRTLYLHHRKNVNNKRTNISLK